MEATRQCTGDCTKCNFQQQTYCSAQRTYAILKNQETIIKNQETIFSRMEDLMKSLAGDAIIPLDAQEGRGAENKAPEDNNN